MGPTVTGHIIGNFTTKTKVAVQLTLLTPRTNRFTRAFPPRGSRDHLRLAESGALPYRGARHCIPAGWRGPSPGLERCVLETRNLAGNKTLDPDPEPETLNLTGHAGSRQAECVDGNSSKTVYRGTSLIKKQPPP